MKLRWRAVCFLAACIECAPARAWQDPEAARRAYERGVKAESAGQLDAALEAYNELLRLNPASTGAQRRRGRILVERGDYLRGEQDLTAALAQNASDGEAWKLLGDARRGLGENGPAVEAYSKALEHKLETAALYRGLAETYAAMGAVEKALEAWANCVRMRLDNAGTYLARGRYLAGLKRERDAIEDFTQALTFDPSLAEAHYRRGFSHGQVGDFERALKDFTAGLELKRGQPWEHRADALLYRGAALDVLGKQAEAMADYTAALDVNPRIVRALLARADLLVRMGKPEDALRDRERAVELDAKNPVVYQARGGSYHALGQHEKGLADRTRALQLKPEDPHSWYLRASAYFLLGRFEQAKLDIDEALRLAPGNAEIAALSKKTEAELARRLAEQQPVVEPARAAEAPKPEVKTAEAEAPPPVQAVEPPKPADVPKPAAKPPSGEACHAAGRALIQAGKFEEAVVQLTCAVELSPLNPLAWNALGFAKMFTGRLMDAVKDFDKALELKPDYANAKQNRAAAFRRLNRE